MKAFYRLTSMILGAAFVLSSCELQKIDNTPEPVFPEQIIEHTIQPGDSFDISFNANLPWTVELEGEGVGNYFWTLDKDEFKASKISGEAGDVTVTVYFSEDEELDVNRVCTVNLTMASKTQKIAEITRFAKERTFSVFVGVAAEEGFQQGDNGEYVYVEAPDTVSLETFFGSMQYSIPVKVVSNYDWTVAFPQWAASETSSGKAGSTELKINAVLSDDLASGTDSEVTFFDASNPDIKTAFTLALPPFADRVECQSVTEMNFNAAGEKPSPVGGYVETPAIAYIMAAKGLVARALGYNGERHDLNYADWISLEVKTKEFVTPLQKDIVVEIKPSANEGAERMADIFVFPASLAELTAAEICDENDNEYGFKEEYKKYYIGRLHQDGAEPVNPEEPGGYITLSDNPEEVYEASLRKETESWLAGTLDAEQVYTLTYTKELSDAVLVFAEAFASYKIFDYNVNEVPENQMDSFWLEFTPFAQNAKGRVSMYPNAFNAPGAEKPESFIAFYDASGKCLAALDCIFDPAGNTGGDAEGVKLVLGNGTVEPMSQADDFYWYLSSEYGTTNLYDVAVSSRYVQLELGATPSSVKILSDKPAFDMTLPELTDGSFTLEGAMNGVFVDIAESVADGTGCIIIFKDENMMNYCAIHFIYDSTAGSAPFSFKYPEAVYGATLEKYTGELVNEIKGNTSNLDVNNIYLLTYTTSSPALITCPREPQGQAAWNNYNDATQGPYENYWLTYEMEGDAMWVLMSDSGKYDYFIFNNPETYQTEAVLVCTCTASAQ